ncbi:MAG TPA: RHS repeat-associated core domain-containing protein [Candidatus Acidoferrum sp.]|nr:RHS repeat-associated core domain-containing protein [Candidatus Acidoferrum sp.]
MGNRLSSSGVASYSYNTSNELTANSLGSYSYDANGNTLSDASGKSYTWDFENRMVQAVVPGTNGGTTTFKYDPFGRRIQKSGPLGTTNYLYDGDDLLSELDVSGNFLTRYAQGEGIDEPLAQFRSGSTSYYETDVLGSVTSTTTPAAAIANSYSYDSFGKTVTSTSPTTNSIRYAARELDSETGIYNDRARYYDPSSGRFISEDPVGFEAGETNFYRYAANDPNDYIDPTGNIIVFSPGSAAGNIVYYGEALGYLGDDPGCSSVIKKLENSPRIFTIDFAYGTRNDGYTSATRTISWDPLGGTCDGGCKLSPAIALCHEMAHAAGDGPIARHMRDTPNAQYQNEEERRVINNYENPFAIRHGECVRFNHNGTPSHVATPTSH